MAEIDPRFKAQIEDILDKGGADDIFDTRRVMNLMNDLFVAAGREPANASLMTWMANLMGEHDRLQWDTPFDIPDEDDKTWTVIASYVGDAIVAGALDESQDNIRSGVTALDVSALMVKACLEGMYLGIRAMLDGEVSYTKREEE